MEDRSEPREPFRMGRRQLLSSAGAAAVVGTLGLARPVSAGGPPIPRHPGPVPNPIPGGVPSGLPSDHPLAFIHWFLPGPEGLPTPVLQLPGMGLDVEPSTLTDFRGFTAFAVLAGEAKASDGRTYACEFDVRVMEGDYIATDGSRQSGAFAFL